MKQKCLNIANITGTVILAITIIIFNLIIGGNEKALQILPIAILMGLSLVVLLIKKIFFKEKIIKNKIDIAVTLFMITLLLPLIFKTYASYSGTVEFILKYFFVYTIYLLARNVVDTKKKLSILIYITIFSSLIFIIFGLDIQNKNYFSFILDKLNLKYTANYRFTSTFGYANAVSIYITFLVFLAINRIENTNSKILKILLVLYIVLGSYIVYISYSRVVLILYIVSLFVYIFAKTYKKFKINKDKLKYIIVAIIGIIAFIIFYLALAMNHSKPYNLPKESKFRKQFEVGKEYNIDLYLDVPDSTKYKNNTKIQIIEVNEYFNETVLAEESLYPVKQKVSLKVTPSSDNLYLKMKINNKGNCDYELYKCFINDEEYIFNYKYIPRIISRLITSFSINDDSIVQRKQFYENSIRIWKDSPIIGHGGNAWKRLSLAYVEYPYAVKETHSYFFELLISYGIIGVAAFIGLIVLLSIRFIKEIKKNKEKRKEKLSIYIGLMLFILYSLTFDFSMSFIVTILAVFIFIALLQFESDDEVNIKFVDYPILISLAFILSILICSNIAKYAVNDYSEKYKWAPYVRDYCYKNVDENNIETMKRYMLKEPYLAQDEMFKKYWKFIKENNKNMSEGELLNNIDFGIERFKKIKPVQQMNFDRIFTRINTMDESIVTLKEIQYECNINLQSRINELKEQMKKEYEVNIINIKDLKRNYISSNSSQRYINKYEEIMNRLDV